MKAYVVRRVRTIDETFRIIAETAHDAEEKLIESDTCNVVDGVEQLSLSTDNSWMKVIGIEEI